MLTIIGIDSINGFGKKLLPKCTGQHHPITPPTPRRSAGGVCALDGEGSYTQFAADSHGTHLKKIVLIAGGQLKEILHCSSGRRRVRLDDDQRFVHQSRQEVQHVQTISAADHLRRRN